MAKGKVGRPAIEDNRYTTVNISLKVHELLKKASDAERRSLKEIADSAILDYLESRSYRQITKEATQLAFTEDNQLQTV